MHGFEHGRLTSAGVIFDNATFEKYGLTVVVFHMPFLNLADSQPRLWVLLLFVECSFRTVVYGKTTFAQYALTVVVAVSADALSKSHQEVKPDRRTQKDGHDCQDSEVGG